MLGRTAVVVAVFSLGACGGESKKSVPDDAATSPDDADEGSDDAAVNTDAGIDGPMPDATIDCNLGCPAGTYDIDNNPLTGTCGCEYACTFASAADAYDAAFTDSNCDGGDGVVDACVYVSTSVGVDTNPGTRAAPMQTITAALQQADLNSVPFVCLSGEVYTEAYTLPTGVGLVGSFDHLDPDFTFRRKSGITTTVNGSTLP